MYSVRPPYLYKKYLSKAVWRLNAEENKIYLTFDDGPIPEITAWVLNLLKEKNIKATFFCVGDNAVKHPEVYKQILEHAHSTGNHSYNHVNGWKTNTKVYLDNVEQCRKVIDSRLFRPPYGKLKKSQCGLLSSQYKIIMWDVLSGDFDTKTSPEKCLKNVVDNVQNGSIILFHDSIKAKRNMQYALPKFIDYALAKGFQFEKL